MYSTEIQSGLPAAKAKDATKLGRHAGIPGLTPSIFSTIGSVWWFDPKYLLNHGKCLVERRDKCCRNMMGGTTKVELPSAARQ